LEVEGGESENIDDDSSSDVDFEGEYVECETCGIFVKNDADFIEEHMISHANEDIEPTFKDGPCETNITDSMIFFSIFFFTIN